MLCGDKGNRVRQDNGESGMTILDELAAGIGIEPGRLQFADPPYTYVEKSPGFFEVTWHLKLLPEEGEATSAYTNQG